MSTLLNPGLSTTQNKPSVSTIHLHVCKRVSRRTKIFRYNKSGVTDSLCNITKRHRGPLGLILRTQEILYEGTEVKKKKDVGPLKEENQWRRKMGKT